MQFRPFCLQGSNQCPKCLTARTCDGARVAVDLDATQHGASLQQVDRYRVVVDPYERAYFDRSKAIPGQLTFQQLHYFGEISAGQLFRSFRAAS
ncbi:MAG TPA: hypothetical protein DCL72_03480 [Rhizobiales bacterium]|nr:hypothetical protein [Hyphomicrobiales bacterium]